MHLKSCVIIAANSGKNEAERPTLNQSHVYLSLSLSSIYLLPKMIAGIIGMSKSDNTDWFKIDQLSDLCPVPRNSGAGYWRKPAVCFGVQPEGAGLTLMLASSPSWEAGQAGEVAGSVDCRGSRWSQGGTEYRRDGSQSAGSWSCPQRSSQTRVVGQKQRQVRSALH